jgi:hypothetical protein
VNILTDELPEAVLVSGHEYAINTDFRASLRVLLAWEDETLTGYEKQMILLSNLYPVMPDDVGGAIEQGMKFLNSGKTEVIEDGDPMRLYSFAQDAGLIFAAFRQTHQIDLETAKIHWWAFLSLFSDLGSETTFCQLIRLRKRVKTGTASAEEVKAAQDMGAIFDLPEPDLRTAEEREAEETFLKLVGANQ